jgi:CheY-like chemotaxis protein/MinD-like ATPase involved in chromosome partitioning or flagellar assembly
VAKKILVVDDDATALRLIGYSLQKEGYEVITAGSGATGMSLAHEAHPDLLLLDVMMPDINGVEVTRRLRAESDTARLPIIMLTAKGQVADKVAGFRAGADDYVVKPVDPSELVARVAAVLARTATASPGKSRIISFVGAKGGVGTTTVAANVGVQMAKLGRAVVLCDLRGDYGTVCLQLSLRPRVTLGKLFEGGAARPSRDVESALAPHPSGLRVLSSPQQPSEFIELESGQVTAVLDAVTQAADVVLLDLPSSASSARHQALERSQFVTLVTEQEPTSLASAKVVVQLLKSHGFGQSNLGAVVVHRTRGAAEMAAFQIAAYLDVGIMGVVPTATEECLIAARTGTPIVLNPNGGSAASALAQIADRLSAEQITPQKF